MTSERNRPIAAEIHSLASTVPVTDSSYFSTAANVSELVCSQNGSNCRNMRSQNFQNWPVTVSSHTKILKSFSENRPLFESGAKVRLFLNFENFPGASTIRAFGVGMGPGAAASFRIIICVSVINLSGCCHVASLFLWRNASAGAWVFKSDGFSSSKLSPTFPVL